MVYDLASFNTDGIFPYLSENIEEVTILFVPMAGEIPSVMDTLVTVTVSNSQFSCFMLRYFGNCHSS